jgi:hypothetical protein
MTPPIPYAFRLIATDGLARRADITTKRGVIRTPAFMPVGTQATVKCMYPDQVRSTGADIILGNTYHLMLRPGAERVAKLGGLHHFARWPHPISALGRAFKEGPRRQRCRALRHRAGRGVSRAAYAVGGRAQGHRLRRLRGGWLGRGRARSRARAHAGGHLPAAARGQAALPDGRGQAGGHRRGGGPRHRYVRLRDAHPESTSHMRSPVSRKFSHSGSQWQGASAIGWASRATRTSCAAASTSA